MIQVSVLYFAAARELAGTSEEQITLEVDATIAQALDAVVRLHPSLAPHLPQIRVAKNETFARVEDRLEAGDVLALIPPVAGG